MNLRAFAASLVLVLALGGCASYSYSNVDEIRSGSQTASVEKSDPAKILLTEGDITDRSYEVVGDLKVTVNKTTIFNADPTREMVNEKLQAEAASLGADAVILVRYGTVGVSLTSWGSLDGNGRAIKFKN